MLFALALLASATLESGLATIEHRLRLLPTAILPNEAKCWTFDSQYASREQLVAETVIAGRWTVRGRHHVEDLGTGDSMLRAYASALELLEDGRPLGPPHESHTVIRQTGGGAYSHWGPTIYFSTRDGSDPRSNGRTYEARWLSHPPAGLSLLLGFALLALCAPRLRRAAAALEGLRPGWICLALLLVALAFRTHYVVEHRGSSEGCLLAGAPWSDARGWDTLASDFANGHVYRSAAGWSARRPFYWIFLGSIYALTGPALWIVQLVHVLLGSIAAALVFDLCRRVAPRPVALVVGIAFALDAADARQGLAPMSETFGSFLSILSLWCLVLAAQRLVFPRPEKRLRPAAWCALAGCVLALSNLARPLSMPGLLAMPLVLLWVAFRHRRAPTPRAGGRLLLAFWLGAGATLAPWLVRQYVAHGIVTLSDNSAVAIYAATTPEYGSWTGAVEKDVAATSIGDRYRAFSAGTARHLHEHLAWYVQHVVDGLQRLASLLAPPPWILIAIALAFLARLLLVHDASRWKAGVPAALAALALTGCAVAWPDFAERTQVVWLAGLLVAAVVGAPVLLAGSLLVVSMGMLSAVFMVDERFSYSLAPFANLVACWLAWSLFDSLRAGRVQLSPWPAEEPPPAAGPARVFRIATAAGLALLLAGCATATWRSLAATAPQQLPLLTADEAAPWIGLALSDGTGRRYAPLREHVRVLRADWRSGYERVLQPGEDHSVREPYLVGRSYVVSTLDVLTDHGWRRVFFPSDVMKARRHAAAVPAGVLGALPPLTDSCLFVGVAMDDREKTPLEGFAIIVPADGGRSARVIRPGQGAATSQLTELAAHFPDAAAAITALSAEPAAAAAAAGTRLVPGDAGSHYPVLYAGQSLRSATPLGELGWFLPLFGADRAAVNPALPRRPAPDTLSFDLPGEYYLALGDGRACKVCVLAPDEPLSASVLRLFDFCVANFARSPAHQPAWAGRGTEYVADWLASQQPALLTSSEAIDLFAALVRDRFALPVRLVTLPGVRRDGDAIRRSNDNFVEVYLPDRGRFVLFDVPRGFCARWLGAADLARAIRSATDGSGELTPSAWDALALDLPPSTPEPLRVDPAAGAHGAPFDRAAISSASARDVLDYGPLFSGGVAYFGAERGAACGTGFLLPQYVFGSLHEDAALDHAVVEWVGAWYQDIAVVRLPELEALLAEGSRQQIAAQAWLARLPGGASR